MSHILDHEEMEAKRAELKTVLKDFQIQVTQSTQKQTLAAVLETLLLLHTEAHAQAYPTEFLQGVKASITAMQRLTEIVENLGADAYSHETPSIPKKVD